MKCDICGKEITTEEAKQIYDEVVCEDCVEKAKELWEKE